MAVLGSTPLLLRCVGMAGCRGKQRQSLFVEDADATVKIANRLSSSVIASRPSSVSSFVKVREDITDQPPSAPNTLCFARQIVLLLGGLFGTNEISGWRHGCASWASDRLCDFGGVNRVVFVRLDIGLHKLRRNNPDLVAQDQEFLASHCDLEHASIPIRTGSERSKNARSVSRLNFTR